MKIAIVKSRRRNKLPVTLLIYCLRHVRGRVGTVRRILHQHSLTLSHSLSLSLSLTLSLIHSLIHSLILFLILDRKSVV